MYDHSKQYRCTIIRGKSQKDMDDLLPAYANIIDEICPCTHEEFAEKFDNAFVRFIPSDTTQKTLDNHRTEISGKLFGMYYFSDDGMVYCSERTRKFLEDSDTPAFFKDICYKMQFPNGSQKSNTVADRIANNISIRPNSFVLKVLLEANSLNIILTKKEIGYYILNSLDVLQGNALPLEVLQAIQDDRRNSITRNIEFENKASSYNYQHINEQINLLELANLVIVDGDEVAINPSDMKTVNLFANKYNDALDFDVYSFDMSTVESRKVFYFTWDEYFSTLSEHAGEFETTAEALGIDMEVETRRTDDTSDRISTTEIGDEGERYVYEYEKRRVTAYDFRLAGKVIHLGKTRGLGYDIQSVIAKDGDNAEFVKYIEVKATKRVTAPQIDDDNWIDTLNITRNEWVAAQQHGNSYSIFRVYFTRSGVVMFVITDVAQKERDGVIRAVPMMYRVDFKNSVVDEVIRDDETISA